MVSVKKHVLLKFNYYQVEFRGIQNENIICLHNDELDLTNQVAVSTFFSD